MRNFHTYYLILFERESHISLYVGNVLTIEIGMPFLSYPVVRIDCHYKKNYTNYYEDHTLTRNQHTTPFLKTCNLCRRKILIPIPSRPTAKRIRIISEWLVRGCDLTKNVYSQEVVRKIRHFSAMPVAS